MRTRMTSSASRRPRASRSPAGTWCSRRARRATRYSRATAGSSRRRPFVLAEEHQVLRRDAESELRDPVLLDAMRPPPARRPGGIVRAPGEFRDGRTPVRHPARGAREPRPPAHRRDRRARGGWIAREAKESSRSGRPGRQSGPEGPDPLPDDRHGELCAAPTRFSRFATAGCSAASPRLQPHRVHGHRAGRSAQLLRAMGAETANVHSVPERADRCGERGPRGATPLAQGGVARRWSEPPSPTRSSGSGPERLTQTRRSATSERAPTVSSSPGWWCGSTGHSHSAVSANTDHSSPQPLGIVQSM